MPVVSDAPRWLNREEDRAWRGVRWTSQAVLGAIAHDLYAESGLSDADYQVLTDVSESAEHRVRFGELASRMGWSTSRLSHHLSRMSDRGLIERRSCGDDGRGSDVLLTPHGDEVIRNAAPDHVESVRRHLFDALDAEQVRHLADITAALRAHHTASR